MNQLGSNYVSCWYMPQAASGSVRLDIRVALFETGGELFLEIERLEDVKQNGNMEKIGTCVLRFEKGVHRAAQLDGAALHADRATSERS